MPAIEPNPPSRSFAERCRSHVSGPNRDGSQHDRLQTDSVVRRRLRPTDGRNRLLGRRFDGTAGRVDLKHNLAVRRVARGVADAAANLATLSIDAQHLKFQSSNPNALVRGQGLKLHRVCSPSRAPPGHDWPATLAGDCAAHESASQQPIANLRKVPVIAQTLDASKKQRLVRYVGILRETGDLPSRLHAERRRPVVDARLVVLFRPRSELYSRIDTRVDTMMNDGLLNEVEGLSKRGAGDTLASTIGYQELLPVLEGARPLEEGVRLIKRNTRRYAKRQLTWYRRYPSAMWMDARTATPDRVLEVAAPWPHPR